MLKQPRRTKHKKMHLGNLKGISTQNNKLLLINSVGIQAAESTWITPKQLEATRKVISRNIKKVGQLFIRIFPDNSVTARARESRMGAGKGSINFWASNVLSKTIIFELHGAPKDIAIQSFVLASYKLPMKTFVIESYNW